MQVVEFSGSYQLGRGVRTTNSLSLLAGWAAALGLSVLANFPESEVAWVHLTGLYR